MAQNHIYNTVKLLIPFLLRILNFHIFSKNINYLRKLVDFVNKLIKIEFLIALNRFGM